MQRSILAFYWIY
uniref:Uncharacterized protein n=1 Tax=Rhizophora mucronata TaxID=61149 RepID=A0A2P2R2D8_RHIMU